MNLSEAIAQEPPNGVRGPTCGVVRALSAFDDDKDRQRIHDLLDEVAAGKRASSSVSRILAHVGVKCSAEAVRKHIRNVCACSQR